MPRFRRKDVFIEAVQWTGQNLEEIRSLIGLLATVTKNPSRELLYIRSQGQDSLGKPVTRLDFTVQLNDWLGVDRLIDEIYSYRPEIFELLYEPATDNPVAEGSTNTAV